jgi:hypothetical protein
MFSCVAHNRLAILSLICEAVKIGPQVENQSGADQAEANAQFQPER